MPDPANHPPSPPHPGRTAAERRALDAIGCGEFLPDNCAKVRQRLLDAGLIAQCVSASSAQAGRPSASLSTRCRSQSTCSVVAPVAATDEEMAAFEAELAEGGAAMSMPGACTISNSLGTSDKPQIRPAGRRWTAQREDPAMIAGLETFAKVRTLHDRTPTLANGRRLLPATWKPSRRRLVCPLQRLCPSWTLRLSRSQHTAPSAWPSSSTRRISGSGWAPRAKRAVRWREVLEEYGTEEAVFEPNPMERALDAAAARFGPDPGWNAYPLSKVPAAIVATVEAAWPMPATVRGAWVEFAFWDKLSHDREARGTAPGDQSNPSRSGASPRADAGRGAGPLAERPARSPVVA